VQSALVVDALALAVEFLAPLYMAQLALTTRISACTCMCAVYAGGDALALAVEFLAPLYLA
jgi:hypothetical protein